MVLQIILADILPVAGIFPHPYGDQKSTIQLGFKISVSITAAVSVKPSTSFHQITTVTILIIIITIITLPNCT